MAVEQADPISHFGAQDMEAGFATGLGEVGHGMVACVGQRPPTRIASLSDLPTRGRLDVGSTAGGIGRM